MGIGAALQDASFSRVSRSVFRPAYSNKKIQQNNRLNKQGFELWTIFLSVHIVMYTVLIKMTDHGSQDMEKEEEGGKEGEGGGGGW